MVKGIVTNKEEPYNFVVGVMLSEMEEAHRPVKEVH